jgi:hypothetical protein
LPQGQPLKELYTDIRKDNISGVFPWPFFGRYFLKNIIPPKAEALGFPGEKNL